MGKKSKILFLSDHMLVPSGVGMQARYLVEGLLATGKYSFFCLGGALQHPDYSIQKIDPQRYGDDWTIMPINGYGDKQVIRQLLDAEKPDALVFFTDPRFFVWLWEMEDEVRQRCPMLYWHVWDNDPAPSFNRSFYDSTDHIAALSMKTYGMLRRMGYSDSVSYIPHAVPSSVFRPIPEDECMKYRVERFGPHANKSFILMWNNRNARRKMTGDVVVTFAKFARAVGKKNVALLMHTSPGDPEGQDIAAIAASEGINDSMIISPERISPEELNLYYNATDCCVNIASNEGFGLGTLECLCAGNPIVVQMTGGLQYQVGDWWCDLDIDTLGDQDAMHRRARTLYESGRGSWWGVPIFPSSRSCTGNQQLPFIYDDRVSHDDVVRAYKKMYEMGRAERRQLGQRASAWACEMFNMGRVVSDWDRVIESSIERFRTTARRPFSVFAL